MLAVRHLVLAFCLALHAAGVLAGTIEGRVVGVADGDTITVLDAAKVHYKIRLGGIDAPEKGQPFGERSKQSLSAIVMGKPVTVEWNKIDRYGRVVGRVLVASPVCKAADCPRTLDVNLAQVTVGLALHYKAYQREQTPADRELYDQAEQDARQRKAGLWSDPDPIPPWEWRHTPTGTDVRLSRNGICHPPTSQSYRVMKQYESFKTMEECLAAGGREAKN